MYIEFTKIFREEFTASLGNEINFSRNQVLEKLDLALVYTFMRILDMQKGKEK